MFTVNCLGGLCLWCMCVIEDCPFRNRCDVTMTVTGQNETKSTCAAHLFLLHVLVIIRIACDVYCVNMKAKLQCMFIHILNNWTLPVWRSVYRTFWLTIAKNLFSSLFEKYNCKNELRFPITGLFFSTCWILKHATLLKPLLTHHLRRSDISLKLCEKFEFQRTRLSSQFICNLGILRLNGQNFWGM